MVLIYGLNALFLNKKEIKNHNFVQNVLFNVRFAENKIFKFLLI